MIFRFDDVCINADMKLISDMTNLIFNKFPKCKVIWAISPLVCDMSNENSYVGKQRIFPKILNAFSDYRVFYSVDKVGVPEIIDDRVTIASHGLIHVDHRLLDKSAQEMSILVSSNLVKSSVFVPPFNKWNKETEDICNKNNIELIKFEDGWRCVEYTNFDFNHDKWYLHAREISYENFKKWLSFS